MSINAVQDAIKTVIRESDESTAKPGQIGACRVITPVTDDQALRIAAAVGNYAEAGEKKKIEAFMKSSSFTDTGRAALEGALKRPDMSAKIRRKLLEKAKVDRKNGNNDANKFLLGNPAAIPLGGTAIGLLTTFFTAFHTITDKDVQNDID